MEAVAHKYWVANQDSPVKKSQQRQPFQSQTNALQTQEHAYPTTPAKPTANHSMNFLTPMSDGDALQPLDSYELFFGKVFATSQANSMWLQDFSNNLVMLVTTEIDQMLLEIQSVLKEARASFRKNRYISFFFSSLLLHLCFNLSMICISLSLFYKAIFAVCQRQRFATFCPASPSHMTPSPMPLCAKSAI